MATKQEIVADIRSLYPGAGALSQAEIKRYIRDFKKRTKEELELSQNNFFEGLSKFPVYGREKYLVIDVADKIYRYLAGAS